ncbi:12359_t:CDS:1, partial [Racocetra persica]
AIYTTALPIIPIDQPDLSETSKSSQNGISTDPTIVSERDAFEKREPIDFTSFNPARDNIR